MAITSTQQTDILKVVAGLFNAAPGGNYLTEMANLVEGGMTISQLADALAAHTLFTDTVMAGKVTTVAQVAVLMDNFGLTVGNTDTASADAQAEAYFTSQIDAGVGFGQIVYDAVTFLSTTTDTAFTTTATLLANKALVAAAYSESTSSTNLSTLQNVLSTVTGTAAYTDADVAAVLEETGSTDGGQTFTLTTGADSAAGTFIDGSLFLSAGTFVPTLNNADTITGTTGTSDTLFVQHNAATTITPANISAIETVQVEMAAAGTISLQNSDASVKTVKATNGTAATIVSNIQSAPTAFEVATTGSSFTATIVDSALTGTSDSTTLTLNSVTAGTTTIGTVIAGSGYETIDIVSSGSVKNGNTTDLVLDDGLSTSLATINISGATALDLDLTPTTVTTVGASTMTGALDIQFAAANGKNVTVTSGTGDDIIDVQGYSTSDTINGGDGTDRLVLTNAEAIGATTTQSNVSGIEVVGLSDGINGTVTVNNFGATGLRFGANTAGASTVAYAAGASNTLDLQTFTGAGGALTATVAGSATSDVLGVTIGSTAAGNTFGAALTVTGAETVNLLSQGGANSFAALTLTDTAATQALVITGDQNFTVTGATRADSINASGMTGSAALTLTGGTGTTATTITGTGNADTLNGSTAGDIINGGAGADTIANVVTGTAATAGDVLAGGDGFDTFILRGDTASAAVATAYAAAANVTDFTLGSTATTTDILQLSATIGNYSGGSAFFAGVAAAAAGSTAVQSVAQNAAAAAAIAGVDMIKLTTGVATTALTVQTAFNAAIGTGTVTGLVANDDIFVSFYDTTNSKMVVGLVNATATTTTIVESGDTITLVGTIDMTAADYASFGANNLSIIAA